MQVLRLLRSTGLDKDACADLRPLPNGTGSETGGGRSIDFAALINTLMPNPSGINAADCCEG